MALARVKTWNPGDVLTAADLNAEFNNLLNNPISLISPTTGAINFQTSVLHINLTPSAINTSSGSATNVLTITGTQAVWAAGAAANPTIDLHPAAAVFSTVNFPQLLKTTQSNWPAYTLAYDQATKETAVWYAQLSTNIASVSSATLQLYYTTTSSAATVWGVNTNAVADGSTFNTLGSTTISSTSTPTVGVINLVSIAISGSSWTTPSVLQVQIFRQATDAGDTNVGDASLYHAALRVTV